MGVTLEIDAIVKIYRDDEEKNNLKKAIERVSSEPDFLDDIDFYDVVSKVKGYRRNTEKFSVLRENMDYYFFYGFRTDIGYKQDVASFLGSLKRFYSIDFHSDCFKGIPLLDMKEIINSMVLEDGDDDENCLVELKKYLLSEFIEEDIEGSLRNSGVTRYEVSFDVSIV